MHGVIFRMNFSWLTKTVSCCILVLFLSILLVVCWLTTSTVKSNQEIYEQVIHAHYIRLARAVDQDVVVFLGSSSIQGLPTGMVYPNSINLGIGGESLYGLESRLRDYKRLKEAKAIVIAAGFNDICSKEDPYINFVSMIDKLRYLVSDDMPLIISALQPSVAFYLCENIQTALLEYNKRLSAYCEKLLQCNFVNLPEEISREIEAHGYQLAEYFEEDKIHLNKRGYDIWSIVISDEIKVTTGKVSNNNDS